MRNLPVRALTSAAPRRPHCPSCHLPRAHSPPAQSQPPPEHTNAHTNSTHTFGRGWAQIALSRCTVHCFMYCWYLQCHGMHCHLHCGTTSDRPPSSSGSQVTPTCARTEPHVGHVGHQRSSQWHAPTACLVLDAILGFSHRFFWSFIAVVVMGSAHLPPELCERSRRPARALQHFIDAREGRGGCDQPRVAHQLPHLWHTCALPHEPF